MSHVVVASDFTGKTFTEVVLVRLEFDKTPKSDSPSAAAVNQLHV